MSNNLWDGIILDSLHKMENKRRQVGGDHYTKRNVQPWDVWEEYEHLGPWLLNAIKYILRCEDKDSKENDLRKAIHYLEYELGRNNGTV